MTNFAFCIHFAEKNGTTALLTHHNKHMALKSCKNVL